jgi:hypothetical protein
MPGRPPPAWLQGLVLALHRHLNVRTQRWFGGGDARFGWSAQSWAAARTGSVGAGRMVAAIDRLFWEGHCEAEHARAAAGLDPDVEDWRNIAGASWALALLATVAIGAVALLGWAAPLMVAGAAIGWRLGRALRS